MFVLGKFRMSKFRMSTFRMSTFLLGKTPQRASALRCAAGAAALIGALAAPLSEAAAGICDLQIYHSERGERQGAASRSFELSEQFVVCFEVVEDGFVSLWDRMPVTGPFERLAPNVNFNGVGTRAVKVNKGSRPCFGDATEGYLLQMDPADGTGRGFMWLIFSPTEEAQPEGGRFADAATFRNQHARVGAGSIPVDASGPDPNAQDRAADGSCTPKTTLTYSYFVNRP